MVFVTGGTGLIGTFLIQQLLAADTAVTALYRQQIPPVFRNNPQLNWVQGDILDTALLRDILKQVEQVYHCAGVVSYAPQDADLLKTINVTGTANIVDACLEHPRIKLCHVSSVAAIGPVKGRNTADENTKWDTNANYSLYASSKYFGELEVWRGISEGLQAVIVNPSVVLGPVVDWNRSSTQLFKYVADQKRFYTKGSANFVDVRDTVAAMMALMESDITAERFILNAGRLSYQDFFGKVAACMGKQAPSVKIPGIVTEMLWRFERLRSLFTGRRPLITKETARIAKKDHEFSSAKIKTALAFEFRPLDQTIAWCCRELVKIHPAALVPVS